MSSPAEGIKDLLVTAGVGTFNTSTGWCIHVSQQQPTPSTSITVYDTGGREPNPQWLVDYPSVQVRVRGDRNGYQAGWAKAKEVKDALIGLPSQDLNGDRWVSIAMISDVTHVEYDSDNRPEFTVNFRLIIEPASGTNRTSL